MSIKETKNAIETLAMSQGFYGRLLRDIESSENPSEIYRELGKGCKGVIDLVFKIEC